MSIRKLHAAGYDTADGLLTDLANAGYWINPGAKVLDYGCGSGALVYRLRGLGFDAVGYDIHQYAELRNAEDSALFSCADQSSVKRFDMTVATQDAKLPYPDDTFDLIVSTSVLEHVLNYEPLFSETARVLKPGGIAFHVYPGRYSFIEPHMYIPLGTVVQNWWWLYFWALIGIRNEYQTGYTARQAADSNAAYCRTGIHYPASPELLGLCRKHFAQADIAWRALTLRSALSLLYGKITNLRTYHPAKAFAIAQRLKALVAVK